MPPPSRRHFLQLSATAAGALILGFPSPSRSQGVAESNVPQWFARFPLPREVWIVPQTDDIEEGMLLESAAGLAAHAALRGTWHTLIYEDVKNDGYQRWFDQFCRSHKPQLLIISLDEVIQRLQRAGIAKGYLLYRFEQSSRPLHTAGKVDPSANVATSLAPFHGGLLVSEQLEPRAQKLGLKLAKDVRQSSEEECLSQADFSRSAVGTADPKVRHCRALMIALNAFVCSGQGQVYESALARCGEDSPVLGWGCQAEDKLTLPSSKWGLFQTATDWCRNLPVFASDTVPAEQLRHPHPLDWRDLDWGDGVHHVNFSISDGDNVQWITGNFTGGDEAASYYGHPRRGAIPFTWGLPVASLCQLSPRTLQEILAKATPNDDFIHFLGGGYFYPDFYGQSRRSTAAVEHHAQRLRVYMEMTGIRVVAFNFQDWDGAAAKAACEVFAAHLPGLLGILAFQYDVYSAGNGAIYWVKGIGGDEVPVVSCRLTFWAGTQRRRDTTPAGVAAHLNRMLLATDSAGDSHFSWVIAHAWSWFRRSEPAAPLNAEERGISQEKPPADAVRGYEPVLWAADRLGPNVKPVTSQELLMRIRLRLRPQATLSRWLEQTARGARTPEAIRALEQARQSLASAAADPRSARRCFELLKGI